MIRENWKIDDEERRRILNLHESATKRNYLLENLITEDVEPLVIDLKTTFPSGVSTFSSTKEVDNSLNKIKQYISQSPNIEQFDLTIESSESKVKQEKLGKLSKKRAETMYNYLQGKLPENVKIRIDDKGAQGPEWNNLKDNKNDPKFTEWQYVKLITNITGNEQSICRLSLRFEGNIGPSPDFFSFDREIVLDAKNSNLFWTFNCHYIPDFVRIIYNKKTTNLGWYGENTDATRLVLGTLLGNNRNLNKDFYNVDIKEVPKESRDRINGLVNSVFSNNPNSVSPFKNALPNLNYGADGRGFDIFTLNPNLIPYTVGMNDIKNKDQKYTMYVGGKIDERCRLQISSPFTQTSWDLNVICDK